MTAQRCPQPPVGVRNDGQASDAGDSVGDLRHCLLIRMDVMGELGFVQPSQAVVEPVYSPALPFEPEAKPASVEPPQHRGTLSQQREMAQVVPVVAKSADDLREVAGVDQGHGDDDRALVFACHQIQDLVHAGPPRLQVLKVRMQSGRKHAMQTETEVLWVADHTSGKPPLQLNGARGLTPSKRAVDPHQHDDDST
jgi:hypothetical protein